jgi:hypothetical protein
MNGVKISKEDTVKLISVWAQSQAEVRTFSSLTTADYHLLCPFIHNRINLNSEVLAQIIPDEMIPSAFLSMLHITKMVSSRSTEMGRRKIINHFLDVAVYLARAVFDDDRLIVDHEYELETTYLPEIGPVPVRLPISHPGQPEC